MLCVIIVIVAAVEAITKIDKNKANSGRDKI